MINQFMGNDKEPPDVLKSEAQRALEERPILSVRSVISLSFALWFFLSLAITISLIIILTKIENKIFFMESAAKYIFQVQQARRFEKNYFLYGTNLKDALERVEQAENILELNDQKMVAAVGREPFNAMSDNVNRYKGLLLELREIDRRQSANSPPRSSQIEDELRIHGAQMVAAAESFLAKERQSVNEMIFISKKGPMLFLVFLLGLMFYCADLIARQMIRPLKVLTEATKRIAGGDITTPVMPVRRYRDEFTELSMAMNSMMHQLAQHQEQLIKSHKLKAVGTLTAGVAHELNNPINNIMLTAAMLQEDYQTLDDAERLDMVKDLVEEAERSRKIIRNLLEFAREGEIDTSFFQINDILEESLRLVANQLRLCKVKVERRFATGLTRIAGDKQKLIQVFVNLAINAIDAMPDGGSLVIETESKTDLGFLEIHFRDSGTGIPEDIRPHVFDPFYTTKSQAKGTGLGLSVSLGIVRKHGGDISVKSHVNQGSVFTVKLPTGQAGS